MDSLAPDAADPARVAVETLAADTSERELIASVLRQDRKAAARFVAAHIDAVYGYARHRLTPRRDLVDDVVQDVFLAALNGLAAFQGQSSLRTWLLGIARHKIEDVYRQRLRASLAFDDLTLDEETRSRTRLRSTNRLTKHGRVPGHEASWHRCRNGMA